MEGCVRPFLKRQQGQGLVEYALIIALVVVVVIVAAQTLGTQSSSVMDCASAGIAGEAGCGGGDPGDPGTGADPDLPTPSQAGDGGCITGC